MPDNTFDDMVNKEKKLLDLSYKQSKANKQERLDNEEKRNIGSFFNSCLSAEEKKKKAVMYQIWYVPRIQDELALANFSNLDDAIEQMDQLKQKRPKAYPHHYIWDVSNNQKVENGK